MNALSAMNPITVTKGAFGIAGTAAGVVGAVARETVRAPVGMTRGTIHLAAAAGHLAGTVARETVHAVWPDRDDEHGDRPGPDGSTAASEGGPTVVAVEPHAPEGPVVDVVGEALAAEAATQRGEAPPGDGFAHEPRGGSRDEEHGDAALQRAEVEEIAEEAAAALEGDIEAEQHLTEPLVDSAAAKAVAADLATMSKAAMTDKG